jgi:hypothetical protein
MVAMDQLNALLSQPRSADGGQLQIGPNTSHGAGDTGCMKVTGRFAGDE